MSFHIGLCLGLPCEHLTMLKTCHCGYVWIGTRRDGNGYDFLIPIHPYIIFPFYTTYLNPYPSNNNLKQGWDRKCLLEAISKYTLPILLIKC